MTWTLRHRLLTRAASIGSVLRLGPNLDRSGGDRQRSHE